MMLREESFVASSHRIDSHSRVSEIEIDKKVLRRTVGFKGQFISSRGHPYYANATAVKAAVPS